MQHEDMHQHLIREAGRLKVTMQESNKTLILEKMRLSDEARELQCMKDHFENETASLKTKLKKEREDLFREMSVKDNRIKEKE